ncbi:Chitin synthase, class 1 [Entophlyctis luteolus]|nr:Chitin synthase, class 1 [Entophlyctis luteolus]KAJ3388301.1 Chitin synthase, class 1 [Entophlyctis sp. JEL0112]
MFRVPSNETPLFRHNTIKTVELTSSGNYVVDIPVPDRVLAASRGEKLCSDHSPKRQPVWTSSETVVQNDAENEIIVAPDSGFEGDQCIQVETDEDDDELEENFENSFWKATLAALLGLPPHKQCQSLKKSPEASIPSKFVTPSIVDDSREFTHLRYTAATCDPDEFSAKGFKLKAQELDRKTEIFIAITMYNEAENLFTKTWKAVIRNISYICSKRNAKVWGPEGWKKIVVCVIADGRTKIHRRTLTVLGIMGVYQEGIIKTSVNGNPTTAHIFEYTTKVYVEQNNSQTVKGPREFQGFGGLSLPPVQVIFCLKELNAKKINSHRWFFNAFGKQLKPEICVLLDVGTKPSDKSIYNLWRVFNKNPHVGGACGEIYADLGRGWCKLLNPLVAAQNFEYKISNILDKPFESCFGFISVLPGAFSAYRFKALQNDENGHGPLEKYFIGESMHDGGDISKANMYLAEDRILCFELVSKRGASWVLKYVRSAKAETDVPDSIPGQSVIEIISE